MAFNFNGNTPKKILYNGLNVAKLVYNGVVVWMSKVLATIEGILPLTLTNCTGDDLVDYRIYGANGGVGDRTGNLFNKNNVVKDVLQDAGQYISGIGCVMFVIDVRNVSVISFQTTVETERCRSAFSVEYPAIGVSYTINGKNTFMNSDGQRNKITRSVPMGANYLGVQVYRNSDNYDEEVINNAINSFIACSGTDIGDYEPFGYKVPVRCGGTTTNIYLDEPLRKTSKLPTGYTQVEYLESTGTQYIDTGVNLSNNSNVEINAKLVATQRSKSYYLLGSRIENKSYIIAVAGATDKYFVDFVSGSYRINSSISALDGKFHTHKVTNLSYYIDGILQGSTSSLTFTNTSSAYIFDVRDRGTPATLGTQSWRIKYCKIWNDNNLIRDFIPCKNPSNVIGMYDTVNDVFYSNAGTGSFVAGAEVETVYYTDYLDYENQKVVRNVDDNDKGIDTPVEESVVLPAVPTDEGTVTVDVDTEIAPSYAEIKYYKNGS